MITKITKGTKKKSPQSHGATERAGRIVDGLRDSPLTTIVEATRADWDRAYRLFRVRKDKDWSFVDCTSIVLCAGLGVAEVLTHDHHFVQAGLRVLLP